MNDLYQNDRGKPTAKKSRTGFTLIEMLVVIAIIALLISLITPAVSRALDTAKTTTCMSNMRQISTAMLEYAAANDGSLPRLQRRAQEEPLGPTVWAGDLIAGGFLDAPFQENQDDIPGRSILRCPAGLTDQIWNGHLPADPWTELPMVHRPWAAPHKVDTGEIKFVHIWYGLNARTDHSQGAGWPFIRNNNQSLRSVITAVRDLDRTVMFYDGVWTHNSGESRIYARHGTPRSTTNFAFFDGRVENMRARVHSVSSTSRDTYPRFRN